MFAFLWKFMLGLFILGVRCFHQWLLRYSEFIDEVLERLNGWLKSLYGSDLLNDLKFLILFCRFGDYALPQRLSIFDIHLWLRFHVLNLLLKIFNLLFICLILLHVFILHLGCHADVVLCFSQLTTNFKFKVFKGRVDSIQLTAILLHYSALLL